MRRLLGIILFLGSQLSVAQIANVDMNGSPARVSGYTGIEGSPYLFEGWSRADISLSNAGLKENVAYKFNIHENELEVINEAGNPIFLTKSYVDYALLERPSIVIATNAGQGMLTKLLFKKGFDLLPGVEKDDLVNVLAEGGYTLVRKFYADLVTPPKNSYAPTAGKMFVFEETLYLIDENDQVSAVRARTNKILKSLLEKDVDLAKQLIKENQLDLSREDHLVIFFQKLNGE